MLTKRAAGSFRAFTRNAARNGGKRGDVQDRVLGWIIAATTLALLPLLML